MQKILLSFLICVLTGCSGSKKFQYNNPSYSGSISKSGLAYKVLSNEVILQEREIFVNKLNLDQQTILDTLTQWLNVSLEDSIHKKFASEEIISISIPEERFYPSENISLDENVYMSVKWPMQGKVINAEDEVPGTIVLFHEVTIGNNIGKDAIYNRKSDGKPIVENMEYLTVIVSYTIWDNMKQQFIQYGIEEATTLELLESKVDAATIKTLFEICLDKIAFNTNFSN